MGKRGRNRQRLRAPSSDYTDADGNVLTLRGSLTPAARAEYAQTLERLHTGMRQLDAPAPHFTERVEEAQSIVRDRSQSPELIDADRELLTNSMRSLRRAVVDRGADEQLLHGEPHAGNLLRTTSGMRFIDLETCCYGPVEFDIAHAPDAVGDHYALADPLLLRDCRIRAEHRHASGCYWRNRTSW